MRRTRFPRTSRAVTLVLLPAVLVACSADPAGPVGPVGPGPASSVSPATPVPPAPAAVSPEQQRTLDTGLIDAAWANDVDRAEDLIGRGADVNAVDETTQSAFLIAASEGYTDLLRLTLENGADLGRHDSYDGTALVRAAERGHADIVGILLQTDMPVDHLNNLGWTALHEALEFASRAGGPNRGDDRDFVDTARLLVAAGADPTLPAASDGRTALDIARDAGLPEQSALLERVAATPGPAGESSDAELLGAAGQGDVTGAVIALRRGAGLEDRNGQGQTPLLVASAADHADVARLLVRLGADPNAVDERSDTPWLVTGVTGSVEVGRLLLAAGADLSATNRFGGLSPHPASERGHADYVDWVVGTGVDIDHVNTPGWTALLEAVVYGDGSERYQRIVRALVGAGADVSVRGPEGRTALDEAEARGQGDVARILAGA
jgi:ankyrin repeat protein